jgi:ribonuclease HI
MAIYKRPMLLWCRKGRLDPVAAEAYAAGMALKTCRALRYELVQFEGDAKLVVDAVNSGEIDRGRIGHVVEDLRAEMTWSISWKMGYVQRGNNSAAHGLAKHAVKNVLDRIWVIPPDCIRDIFLSEQFALSANF